MKTVSQRDLMSHVRYAPDRELQTYGAMSYTPSGHYEGRLPSRIASLLWELRKRQPRIPMIYSYGTPIAWYDFEHSVWVRPDVSYSVTTSKHQSYLSDWRLSVPIIVIPGDCGLVSEYERYVSQKMTYSRWSGIKPGPNWTP